MYLLMWDMWLLLKKSYQNQYTDLLKKLDIIFDCLKLKRCNVQLQFVSCGLPKGMENKEIQCIFGELCPFVLCA